MNSSAADPPGVTLDREVVDEFRRASQDGNADFLISLIDLYLREAAVQVAGMTEALTSGDALRAKATAHTLKGSSLVMGAQRLAQLCAQVESDPALLPGATATASVVAAINEEFARVSAAFESERHS